MQPNLLLKEFNQTDSDAVTLELGRTLSLPLLPERDNQMSLTTNALWYHALWLTNEWTQGTSAYHTYIEPLKVQIQTTFWLPSLDYCSSWITSSGKADPQIFAYPIIACTLRSRLLTTAMQKKIVQVVKEHLWTPLGIRSLAPFEATYQGYPSQSAAIARDLFFNGAQKPWLSQFFYAAWAAHPTIFGESVRENSEHRKVSECDP